LSKRPATPRMKTQAPLYEARRTRGLVWVCDVIGSSRLLNRNETAASTEEFLQRFLYLSLLAVNSGGGTFVKWTGDGFLAFFETPLDRELGATAEVIFDAAFWLTLLVNVTQLCSASQERIRIRHAVTYEKDALFIDLQHSGDMKSKDVLGRSVVAAFRLSGISCDFPGIVTHREVLRGFDEANMQTRIRFKGLPFTAEMRLRHFKGETFGTRDVYVSANRQPRKRARSLKSAQRAVDDLLRRIDSGSHLDAEIDTRLYKFRRNFFHGLNTGPSWFEQIVATTFTEFMLPGITALRKFTKLSRTIRRKNVGGNQ